MLWVYLITLINIFKRGVFMKQLKLLGTTSLLALSLLSSGTYAVGSGDDEPGASRALSASSGVASAATGGALGARAGPIGALIGGVVATYLEQKFLCWKDVCCCECDDFGNLNITYYSNSTEDSDSY